MDRIPGSESTSLVPSEPANILVMSPPKHGKSCLATTLIGWPEEGCEPAVLAFDPTGPDSCAQLGFQLNGVVKVVKQPLAALPMPGDDEKYPFFAKTVTALTSLEQFFRKRSKQYTSLVIDCASTMTSKLLEDAEKVHKDGRAAYGAVLKQSKEVYSRMTNLGIPTIWLSWLQEPYESKDNKGRVTAMNLGGPKLDGSFKAHLAGSVHMMLMLEKKSVGRVEGADASGCIRQFHTKTWNRIECSGRYALPEPMPANLGLVLAYHTGMLPNPAIHQNTGT
jgi:hypothetical protein